LGLAEADFEHLQQQHGFGSAPGKWLWQHGRFCNSEAQYMQQHFWQAQTKRGAPARTVAAAVTQTSKDTSALRSCRIMGTCLNSSLFLPQVKSILIRFP
jgi:hypothetical protein